jgi:drug/metabolite transporter (DMT)-like permease
LCIAQSTVSIRRYPAVHPVVANAVGMGIGAVLLLAASFAFQEKHAIPANRETWVALLYLVLVGSVVVFALFLIVLKHWAASRAAYLFVVAPVVTIALSAWLDDEPVGLALVGGGLLVVAGVYVGALRRAPA